MFQYGDLHFGQRLGCKVLIVHVCPHLKHLACGSDGMSSGSMILSGTYSCGCVSFIFTSVYLGVFLVIFFTPLGMLL